MNFRSICDCGTRYVLRWQRRVDGGRMLAARCPRCKRHGGFAPPVAPYTDHALAEDELMPGETGDLFGKTRS